MAPAAATAGSTARYATPARYRAASCSDLFADERARDHVGDAWYQTTVRVPAGRAERRR